MKGPPVKDYRKNLGSSEKRRVRAHRRRRARCASPSSPVARGQTHLEMREKSLDVAKDQRTESVSTGVVVGGCLAILVALVLALLVNWILAE